MNTYVFLFLVFIVESLDNIAVGSSTPTSQPSVNFQSPSVSPVTLSDIPSYQTFAPTVGVNKQDRCFRIAGFDSFGDGWDTAKLFVLDSMHMHSSYAPNTTHNNAFHVEYCFSPTPIEGDYVTFTVVGFQPKFYWEIEWQVLLSSGQVYIGSYGTTMTFSFSYNCDANNTCNPSISLMAAENLVVYNGKTCEETFSHSCSGYFEIDNGTSLSFGDSHDVSNKFAKEVEKRTKKPVADPTRMPTDNPTTDPTSYPSFEPTRVVLDDGLPKAKPPPKPKPKPAPKPIATNDDDGDWGDLGLDDNTGKSGIKNLNGKKNRTVNTNDWGGLDWVDKSKSSPGPSKTSSSSGSKSRGNKDDKDSEWGDLSWDVKKKGPQGKGTPSPSKAPTTLDLSSIKTKTSPKPKPSPGTSASKETIADNSTIVTLVGYDDSWFSSDGMSTMFIVSDELGKKRYDYGTLCPGNDLIGGTCISALDDGPYVFRVNGGADPHRNHIHWEFCYANGTVNMELLFIMTKGVCKPLRNRPISLVNALGHKKYENDEIIIRANIAYGSSYKPSSSRRLSMLTEDENNEISILSRVMTEEFHNTVTHGMLTNAVSLKSWKLCNPDEHAGADVREAIFEIKISASMFGVDPQSETKLKMLGAALNDHFSSSMDRGLFLAHMKSEALRSSVTSLGNVDFVRMTGFEVTHLVHVNEEMSQFANIIVVVGCVLAIAAAALMYSEFRYRNGKKSYSRVPIDIRNSINDEGEASRKATCSL